MDLHSLNGFREVKTETEKRRTEKRGIKQGRSVVVRRRVLSLSTDMNTDKNLYTDIACMRLVCVLRVAISFGRLVPQLVPRPQPYNDELSNRIDKTMKEIQMNVAQLGRILNEMKPPLCSVDPMRKRVYESVYQSLVGIISSTPTLISSCPQQLPVQRLVNENFAESVSLKSSSPSCRNCHLCVMCS